MRMHHILLASCLMIQAKTLTNSNSCPISRETVEFVEDCPNTERKWKEAIKRKNCKAYASQCSEPERLEYHCVINPYANQSLEVCAYAQNIVLGYCTEYSITGNLIQRNVKTNCSRFVQHPCPNFYRSTEVYKYPGCYKLTKKSPTYDQTVASDTTMINKKEVTDAQHEKMEDKGKVKDKLFFYTFLFVTFCFLLFFTLFPFLFLIKMVHCRKKDYICNV